MKALICVLWAVNRLSVPCASAYGKMTGHINACIFWRDLTVCYCLRRQLARLSIVRITRWPNVRHRLSADSSVSSPSRAFPAATVTAFMSANGFPFLRTDRRVGSLPSLCFFCLAFASVHNVNDHFSFRPLRRYSIATTARQTSFSISPLANIR